MSVCDALCVSLPLSPPYLSLCVCVCVCVCLCVCARARLSLSLSLSVCPSVCLFLSFLQQTYFFHNSNSSNNRTLTSE